MESLQDIARRQQRSRPTYYDDPEKDALVALTLELAEEICVLRDRLADAQRLAANGTMPDDAALDACPADEALDRERLAGHTRFFEDVLERIANGGQAGS